tara:strand:- start:289 stop:477 length:189 start_codon:yes stop_codon:yes gene_type:complete
MAIDETLRMQQRTNDLNVFLRYEQRLKLAYARSQNPQPKRWYGTNNSWGSQRMGNQPSLDYS